MAEPVPVDFDPFAQRTALADAQSVGSFVGDKRKLTDEQRLVILREQRNDPNMGKTWAPELEREIAGFERGARGAQIATEARRPTRSAEPIPVDFDPFSAPTPPQPEMGETMKGIVGGLTGGNPKMVGAAAQGAGTVIGWEGLRDWGATLAKAGQDTLANYQPAVGSIKDVRTDSVANTLSDFFTKYLPYQTGNALSSMAPTIATGLLGAAAGAMVAGPPGAAAGGLAGTVLTGYPMNYGDIYSDAKDDKGIQQAIKEGRLTERDVAAVTMVAAVPITALDSWSLGRFGQALTAPVKQALYKRIFSEMAQGALREGSTEGLQQVISEVVQQGLGSDKSLKDAAVSVADNAIGGMAGGGVTGGAAGAVQRQQPPAPATTPAAPTSPAPAPAAPMGGAPDASEPPVAPGLPREAAQAVAGGFHVEPPPGSQIPAVPFSQTDVDLGRAEGATNAQQSQDEGRMARELAGAIPYEGSAPATEGASPLEQARLDAQILQAGGSLFGVDPQRARNATLVAVYGENNAVHHAIENPQLSGIGDAMLAVAPMVEKVRASIQEGERNRDITMDLVGAVDELATIRAGGQDPAQVIAHGARHDLSYEAQELLQFLDENQGNPQALADFMERYLQIVQDMGGAPSQVRGRAFDIIQERAAARRQAQEAADAVAKEQAFQAQEQATQRQKRVEEAKAREVHKAETLAQHEALGEAAAGAPTDTAMAVAFQNAKPLKGKREKPTAGAVSGEAAGSPQAGPVEPRAAAKPGAGAVPQSAEARDARHAQPVRAGGDEAGVAETRAAQIEAERKYAEASSAVMVTTRAIDAKTGKRIKVTERANVALKGINHQIQVMEALLECLG